jgi:hypothetical protein
MHLIILANCSFESQKAEWHDVQAAPISLSTAGAYRSGSASACRGLAP